jgi:hypothetical protein
MRPAARRPLAEDAQPSPQWPPPYGEASGQQQPGYAPPPQGYGFPQAGGEGEAAAAHPLPFNRFPRGPEASANFGYPPHGGEAPQQGSGAPPWAQQGDAHGFDLGNYMSAPGQGYAQADAGHFDPPPFAAAPHGYGDDAEFDEAMGEDEEEPRRGRRGLMIVVALVGAIGLGGGMAYAYKSLFPSRSGPAPLIKDTQGPIKSKPEVADGRGFAHTDKKLLNRLGDDTGPQGAGQANPTETQDERVSDDPSAPRKVRLIPIPTGGQPSVQPPVQAVTTTAPPASAPAMALPPGVTIDNMGPPRMPPPSVARPQPPPAAPARVVPQPPVRVASPASMPPSVDAEPAAPVKKAAAPVKVPKNPVPKTKEASAAPSVTAASGAGYVAVLSSQKSRMDALKIFANMQEKYGEALSSRTPDVQEANLGEKGVWYRLVVGPPGSRDAAASVCTQLKSAGYSGCWVTAY